MWVSTILVILSSVSLVTIFINGLDTSPIAYAAYVVAFYALTAVCAACVNLFPRWYKNIKGKVYGSKYGNRYMTDVIFKTRISLYRSLTVNMLYVGTNIVSYFLYDSAWFAILAGYYTILAVMRFLLLRFTHRLGIGKDKIMEYKRSRLCGIILITVNLTLSGAVLMILYQNKGYQYHGILIYAMALYTFYVTAYAIVNIIRYRKYNSPIMTSSKIITLSAALVSMLPLETAMFSQFGTDTSHAFQRIMIAATGAGISVAVISMSVYIIVKSTQEINKTKTKGQNQ